MFYFNLKCCLAQPSARRYLIINKKEAATVDVHDACQCSVFFLLFWPDNLFRQIALAILIYNSFIIHSSMLCGTPSKAIKKQKRQCVCVWSFWCSAVWKEKIKKQCKCVHCSALLFTQTWNAFFFSSFIFVKYLNNNLVEFGAQNSDKLPAVAICRK